MKIAICDDEKYMLELLYEKTRNVLAKDDIDAQIALFSDGESLLESYRDNAHPYDMLMLDIKMDGLDGIRTAERIRATDADVLIVFVTSSAEYVFCGYEVKAFRYLMKNELDYGFDKVFRDTVRELNNTTEHWFTFQFGNEKIRLETKHINYFESSRRVVRIALDQEEYKTYAKLDDIEQELQAQDFIRCHQSYLVNVAKIEKVSAAEIELKNGETLPVSKKYRKSVNDAYLWMMR
ncbi:MAG: response regulator transcription factor [Clostridia bacterium]|nr:response regulator transcription factor [Clostridia bacterium]